MNSKIKELFEKSTTETSGKWLSMHDAETFAKLVIGECAGIYSKIDNGNLHLGTDNYLEALHKHFSGE